MLSCLLACANEQVLDKFRTGSLLSATSWWLFLGWKTCLGQDSTITTCRYKFAVFWRASIMLSRWTLKMTRRTNLLNASLIQYIFILCYDTVWMSSITSFCACYKSFLVLLLHNYKTKLVKHCCQNWRFALNVRNIWNTELNLSEKEKVLTHGLELQVYSSIQKVNLFTVIWKNVIMWLVQ